MAHRNDPNRGTPHTGTATPDPRHYAAPRDPALYDGMPSVTNRRWGEDHSTEADSYGRHLQGYGDFTQGGYGESQGPDAQSGHVARGFRGRGPKGYQRSDERIRDDIVDRLTDADDIDASEILLMIEDGVVTLTGNVPVRAMKHRAEDIAAEASGVRDVRNKIRVDNGAASFGPPGRAVR